MGLLGLRKTALSPATQHQARGIHRKAPPRATRLFEIPPGTPHLSRESSQPREKNLCGNHREHRANGGMARESLVGSLREGFSGAKHHHRLEPQGGTASFFDEGTTLPSSLFL